MKLFEVRALSLFRALRAVDPIANQEDDFAAWVEFSHDAEKAPNYLRVAAFDRYRAHIVAIPSLPMAHPGKWHVHARVIRLLSDLVKGLGSNDTRTITFEMEAGGSLRATFSGETVDCSYVTYGNRIEPPADRPDLDLGFARVLAKSRKVANYAISLDFYRDALVSADRFLRGGFERSVARELRVVTYGRALNPDYPSHVEILGSDPDGNTFRAVIGARSP